MKKVGLGNWGLVLLIWLSILSANGAMAGDPAPLTMMKGLSSRMLGEMTRNLGRLKGDEGFVKSLVKKILVPHFDLTAMSQAVVGRNDWQQANAATQGQFIREFTNYVIATYASAMRSYDGETMKFHPIRGAIGERVKVSSDLVLKNGPAIQLQYSLAQQGKGWLIYDFSVDGVSIVKNYQAQFASKLRQTGLVGLVKELQQRNARQRG